MGGRTQLDIFSETTSSAFIFYRNPIWFDHFGTSNYIDLNRANLCGYSTRNF
jgi:hypothetical protein